MNKEEVINLIRSEVGTEEISQISDRTLEGNFAKFEAYQPEDAEKCKQFWLANSNFLKEEVKGNINFIASKVAKNVTPVATQNKDYEDAIRKAEEAKLAASELQKITNETNAKLAELAQFKAQLEAKEAQYEKDRLAEVKRKQVAEWAAKSDSGLSNEVIRDLLLESINYSTEESSEDISKSLKEKYDAKILKYTKTGNMPFASAQTSTQKVDTNSFLEKKRKDREAEEARRKEFNKNII